MQFKHIKVNSILMTIVSILTIFDTATAIDNIYVTKTGCPAPTGLQDAPYQLVEVGIVRANNASVDTVQITGGKYYETITIDTPCILKAIAGTVTIGKLDYSASTTLEIITLNTHLFGDVVGPSWQDYARADDIADSFGGSNPQPDVVSFQEIWDEDLFFGGDGANGILLRSVYNYGDHGDDVGPFLNSGLAIMSLYPLQNFQQVEFDEENGLIESEAAKGWVQTTIVKDGFSIGIFNTHTQADYGLFDLMARDAQVGQLSDAILSYRFSNPDHVVFVMGDLNIYDDDYMYEYNNVLISKIGEQAGGRDTDRNMPGFFIDGVKQWTYSADNPLAYYFDDDARGGRLDYIFYFPSLNGAVEVLPTYVNVLQFAGRMLSEDDLTTNQSSDHWAVHGQFKLIRP